MRLILWIIHLLMLLKLSLDDLKMHRVYERDLVLLCVGALGLLETKRLDEWFMILAMISGLLLFGSLRQSLGTGDLPVILTMGLTLSLNEFQVALQGAALLALSVFYTLKKTPSEEVPFVPYLSACMMILYLIRLRFIFS